VRGRGCGSMAAFVFACQPLTAGHEVVFPSRRPANLNQNINAHDFMQPESFTAPTLGTRPSQHPASPIIPLSTPEAAEGVVEIAPQMFTVRLLSSKAGAGSNQWSR
jgi:hypothetical protein